jgi:hypothetical protein
MYVPPFMRYRRDKDKDGMKQPPRQHQDGKDDGKDDNDDDNDYDNDNHDDADVDDEDHPQQEHRTRCFGSNSLVLLSLLLTSVVIGSGFLFLSILPAGRITRFPITIGTTNTNPDTITNINTNVNTNTNRDNLSIATSASTTEGFALFVKDIYRELLQKYTTMIKVVDSESESEYDGVFADGNFKKYDPITEQTLEPELNSLGNVYDKEKGYRKLKRKKNQKPKTKTKKPKKKKPKPPKTIFSLNGLSASPKSSLSKKILLNDLKRFTKEILSIDGVIQSSNPFKKCIVNVIIPRKTDCNNVYPSDEGVPKDVKKCYEYKISISGSNADDAIELVAKEISSDKFTTDFGYRVILEPSPELDTAIVEVLAAPLKSSSPKKLISDLTRVAKEILGINDLIKPSNVYKDSIVKVNIAGKIDCNDIFTDRKTPKKVKNCYEAKISITGSNADDAIRFVTKEVPALDLSFVVVVKPSFVPFVASVNGLAGPPSSASSKSDLKKAITRVTKGIIGLGDALSSSNNPFKDCIVKVVIPKTTDCNNIYTNGQEIPKDVQKCYGYKITIKDNGGGTCDTEKAIEVVTTEISKDEYTDDLKFDVIIDPKE